MIPDRTWTLSPVEIDCDNLLHLPTLGTALSAHKRLPRARLLPALRGLGPFAAPSEQIGLLQTKDGPLLWALARHGGLLAA